MMFPGSKWVLAAVTAVATVALARWGLTRLVSSSEEDQKTSDHHKDRIKFEDSPYDCFTDHDQKTNEHCYQIPSNQFEDSHSESEDDQETDDGNRQAFRRDYQISGKPICWIFPGNGKLKLNTDGSVKWRSKQKDGSTRDINAPRAGFGGVIRDERGFLILGFYGRLKDGCKVLEAELWGIYKGLEIIRGRNYREVEIESDSSSAIYLIKDETAYKRSPFALKKLVEKCKAVKQETGCTLEHALREGNRVADKLAKRGRDQNNYDLITFTTPPYDLMASLLADIESSTATS